MTLADEQYSYNGLVFGKNCDVMVNKATGVEGYVSRSSDVDLPRGDGAIRGVDYLSPRLVDFQLVIIESSDLDGSIYEGLWSTVRAAFAPSAVQDLPLVFKRPGMPERMVVGRPVQLTRTEAYLNFNRFGFPPVMLRAVDPRIYSTALHLANVNTFASSPTGVDLPLDWPVDFPAGTQIETVCVNNGLAPAFPLIRFYGPASGTCTAVTLLNSTTGQSATFNLSIPTGSILTADMGAAVSGSNSLVVGLDGASRYGNWALPRTPFYLAPGSNTLRLLVTGTSTNVIANVQWRDTWTA